LVVGRCWLIVGGRGGYGAGYGARGMSARERRRRRRSTRRARPDGAAAFGLVVPAPDGYLVPSLPLARTRETIIDAPTPWAGPCPRARGSFSQKAADLGGRLRGRRHARALCGQSGAARARGRAARRRAGAWLHSPSASGRRQRSVPKRAVVSEGGRGPARGERNSSERSWKVLSVFRCSRTGADAL